MAHSTPIKLTSPRVWRTYLGGSQIDAIHGADGTDGQFPEEWIASIVTARNVGREHITDEGLCYLEGTDVTLRQFIEADPRSTLGSRHAETLGATTGVLVKIIDAAERLTVQAHPDKQRATELFGSPFGKTECWHILGCRTLEGETPCLYIGFKEGITREKWKACFDAQNIPEMLNCLHQFEVQPGETYLIPGGVPHAIGSGCLLIEIQEPTDFTVRTERVTPKGLRIKDTQCHQGLGFEKMFDVFTYEGRSAAQAKDAFFVESTLVTDHEGGQCRELIGTARTDCFRLEQYTVQRSMPLADQDTMSAIYIFQGCGILRQGENDLPFTAGQQFFLPAGCAGIEVQSTGETPVRLFRCFGPTIR